MRSGPRAVLERARPRAGSRPACAGARPTDRDSVDARILADIVAGTGQVIDTVPPLPDLSGGTHVLPALLTSIDPLDWVRDSDGDGYTDVEEELHAMAAAVECP